MKTSLLALPFFMAALLLSGRSYSQESLNTRKLDSLFEMAVSHQKMMGSVCISKRGKVLYSKAFGHAGLVKGVEKDANTATRYRIGSISKMFTATMIFQLIDENKLKLDAKLSTYYPHIANAEKISILSMLNHHSGMYNFTSDTTYATWCTKPQTHAAMLARLEKQPADFEPTERGEYSNTNYLLLGYIIEKVTGKTYAQALQERILSKVGLKGTFCGGKINTARNEAISYTYSDKAWKAEAETDMSVPGGAGVVVSTPEDLNRFIIALFDGKLISKASLEKMKIMDDDFGRGLLRIPFYSRFAYGHNGEIDGFQSMLSYFPQDSVAFSFCFNAVNYDMNNLMIGALSTYFRMPYKIPTFESIAISSDELKKYEGIYVSAGLPLKITIKEEKGTLTAQATGQSAFPLEAISRTEFHFDGGGIVLLFADEEKTMVLKQGGGQYAFTRESVAKN